MKREDPVRKAFHFQGNEPTPRRAGLARLFTWPNLFVAALIPILTISVLNQSSKDSVEEKKAPKKPIPLFADENAKQPATGATKGTATKGETELKSGPTREQMKGGGTPETPAAAEQQPKESPSALPPQQQQRVEVARRVPVPEVVRRAVAQAVSIRPSASDSSAAVLVAGRERFTRDQFETLINSLPGQMRDQLSNTKARAEFASHYAEMRILANEGRRRRIETDPKTAARIRYGNDQSMAAAFTEYLADHAAVTDREMRRFYEENVTGFQRVRGQMVTVKFANCDPDSALAKLAEMRRRVQTGEDFASVVRRETAAAVSDVDLAFGQGDQTLLASVRALRAGQLSEPIRTAQGYHLLLVRENNRQEYLDVRDEIEKRLRPEFARRTIEEIKRNAGIKLDPRYFGNS